jgi:Lrp/AsnC family transcriptional regulator, leucine-responsive regulatory protein
MQEIDKIDKVDRRILFELDQNCRIPDTKLAKIVGKSKESIRYRINNLIKSGVIKGFTTYTNNSKLGYMAYKIYLKTREKTQEKKRFVDYLKNRPDVFWLGIGDGAWDIGLTLLAKSNEDFFNEKNRIFSEFKDIMIEGTLGSIVEAVGIGQKFFVDDSGLRVKPAIVISEPTTVKLDEKDIVIVNALLANGRMRLVELVRESGISLDSIRNRKKRLEQEGVIQRYRALVDHRRLRMEMYKTFLYLEGFSPDTEKKLFSFCKTHPNIVNYVKVIAPWSIELEMIVESYSDYNKVISKIKEEFADSIVNVDSIILSEDYLYPAKMTVMH